MVATGGLRERKKAATRQALHRAAVELVAEHGFDQVTVEAIADAAMVSRRTFSNYFSGKEEALLHGDRERMRRLVAHVHERPADEGPWPALLGAIEELVADNDDVDPDWLSRRRTLRRHHGLAAAQVTAYATVERELAAEVAARMGGAPDDPDLELRARTTASAFLAVVRVATEHWLDHHAAEPLVTVIRRALAGAPIAAGQS
jgi:AcrR family transcriptional regulator